MSELDILTSAAHDILTMASHRPQSMTSLYALTCEVEKTGLNAANPRCLSLAALEVIQQLHKDDPERVCDPDSQRL